MADGDKHMAQRNRLVALLAGLFPSWHDFTDIGGWDDKWHGCVYIETPAGQVSFHYHDSQRDLFNHVRRRDTMREPPKYDGHDDKTKWARIQTVTSIAGDLIANRDDLHQVLAELRQTLKNIHSVNNLRRQKLVDALAKARARDVRQRAELHRLYTERDAESQESPRRDTDSNPGSVSKAQWAAWSTSERQAFWVGAAASFGATVKVLQE